MHYGILAAGSLSLSACNSTKEENAIWEARDAVGKQMRDESSAQFRNIEVHRIQNGRLVVCGSVNGKNAFGAMTGYARFVHVTGGATIMEDTAPAELMDTLWNTDCSGPVLERRSS